MQKQKKILQIDESVVTLLSHAILNPLIFCVNFVKPFSLQ